MCLYDMEWTLTNTNTFSNLANSNDLASWLNDSEQFEKVANGKTQHDVFNRWDQPMEKLAELSPGVRENRVEDTGVTAHGRHPKFVWLTAESEAGKGAFLGEL